MTPILDGLDLAYENLPGIGFLCGIILLYDV